jgi:hypothetical protein
MLSFIGSAIAAGAVVSLGGVNLDAVLVYGLVAFVIGLITWSKYNEPALSNPYPEKRTGHDLSEMAGNKEVGPLGAIPVVVQEVPNRKRP